MRSQRGAMTRTPYGAPKLLQDLPSLPACFSSIVSPPCFMHATFASRARNPLGGEVKR
jgi:hypothetical protein